MKNNENCSPVIGIHNVSKVYESSADRCCALSGINLKASSGEFLLLLGPSGSGKTSLLTIAAGFSRPSAGSVLLFGKEIGLYSQKELQYMRAEKIGFIFQTFLLIDALTIYENVELALRFSGAGNSNRKKKTIQALEKAGITELAKKRPREVSHGQRQKAAIARAFANDAELIIADEPTASLDSEHGLEIIELLRASASVSHKCVITASHDSRIKSFADTIIYMENGRIVRTINNTL